MTYIPESSLEEMLLALNPFIEAQAEGTTARQALEMAQAGLLYIRDHHQEDFAQYYRRFSDTSFKVEVSHEFATRAEADTWLLSGDAKDSERVKIAGKGFMVVQVSGRWIFMIAPLPEELREEAGNLDSE